MREKLVSFLRSTELFRFVGQAAVEELASNLRVIYLADGQALVSEGDQAHSLYLLMSGRLLVTACNLRNGLRPLFSVNPGESANESAILSADSVSAAIVSAGESSVLEVPRAIFESFSQQHPTDAIQVMQELSGRLQRYQLSVSLHLNKLFDNLEADVLHDLDDELEMFTL